MNELKNILVTTDFSKGSYNALVYAIEVAKICGAQISLLHAYRLISSSSHREEVHLLREKLESEIASQFKKILDHTNLEKENQNLIHCVSQIGFPEGVIEFYIRTEPVDLIVMGTSGVSNKTFGNTFSTVAKNTKLPILAIPHTVSFKKWKRIFLSKESDKSSEMIPYLVNKFDAQFDINKHHNVDVKNLISDTMSILPNDLLSIQPNEYVLLEEQIDKNYRLDGDVQLLIPLLIT